ncbi:uncharacterized protein BO95DRAFT_81054 [Aspergillus brunneoviolaceus CBS 621.78]|uniref:Uncharacterized protein n=1 Tax=Aspergillus brunneoviolaceus CBS 621.78 TaxID=1450534 RepID=A0ACD1GEA2_9EURO|nr:hypothetical protein BO95DRAFT_81054 [Aspergillus brunneoviolaceus CBS 621.78]RAH47603.1 hypothetical protein BO95DRAFT_81054 [Aspergillus brunneoviolaceus CBS 621.78]
MVRGDPRYSKMERRHCLLYIQAPFSCFSLDCCSILLLCAVTGNASLNIISDRHDHHHHQLSLSIYQHSRVPGEWVYCFCCLLILTCIPRLFYVMCVCVSTTEKTPFSFCPAILFLGFTICTRGRRENADGEMFRHWKISQKAEISERNEKKIDKYTYEPSLFG